MNFYLNYLPLECAVDELLALLEGNDCIEFPSLNLFPLFLGGFDGCTGGLEG